MSSVPSSAQASCFGKCFASGKGRRVNSHVVVLMLAIMHPSPVEFVIEVGIRAYGGVSTTHSGVLSR